MAGENATPNSTAKRPTVYSVPRRYDLFTLIVVTIAFSVLFAGLKLIKAQPALFLLIVGFFVFVGLSQAILPTRPRAASFAAGAVFFVIALVVLAVRERMPGRLLSVGIVCFGIQGAFCGYFGGALIGGVFLAADYCRNWHRRG